MSSKDHFPKSLTSGDAMLTSSKWKGKRKNESREKAKVFSNCRRTSKLFFAGASLKALQQIQHAWK